MAQGWMAMVRVVRGFAPWILSAVFAAAGWPRAGLALALALAAGLCIRDARRGRPKVIEWAALGFFSARALADVALGVGAHTRWDALLASAALAVVAWGSILAGAPFTLQYAREDWPEAYWRAPLFVRLNILLSGLWGLVFTANAVLAASRLAWPSAWPGITTVGPPLLIVLGVAASVLVPGCYPCRWAARQIAAREPYTWPAPTWDASFRAAAQAHDVVIVGAGIGGLTAGALLADRGLRVLVLDQHFLPGGFCTTWARGVRRGDSRLQYVFDAGVHDVSGLGPRGAVRLLLRRLGTEDRIEWRRTGHEHILPGLRLKVPREARDLAEALAERFPAERDAIHAFLSEMERVYRDLYADVEATGGVPRPPATVDAMLAWPAAHPHAFRWMDVPFGRMLDTYLRDERLKEFLSVLTGYLTDDPTALTVGAMAPIFGYYFDGGFYPVGGSQALADVLVEAIQAHGGEVRLRTPVARILVEGGRAAGVVLASGQVVRAAAVVSNADVGKTLLGLAGPEHLPRDLCARTARLAPSTSAFVVYLGVDYVPDLEPVGTVRTAEGALGIAIPSRVDPSLAPPGHATITLTALVPAAEAASWDRKAPGYAARKRATGDRLIALAETALPGLREHIVYRQEGSPATFARYAWTTGGAIYGPATGTWRPPAKSPIPGLVLAGAGVFPGAGVEAVVISGTLAADALCPTAFSGPPRRSQAPWGRSPEREDRSTASAVDQGKACGAGQTSWDGEDQTERADDSDRLAYPFTAPRARPST